MDFWQNHGWLFLLGLTVFPRITLLFFSSVSFGFWIILGWIFVPHFVVAILATSIYWNTNPVLCIIAWFVAFGATGGEGAAVNKAR